MRTIIAHATGTATGADDEPEPQHEHYVANRLGRGDGVLIVDDTGFLKKGTTSAGVQRQYSGTAGRTENCQIGVFAAYASRRGRALVDRELYPPKSWTGEAGRCRAARVPASRGFATKGELARAMILRALASPLPIAWVTGDCAYGQEWRARRSLTRPEEIAYFLAYAPNETTVGDLVRVAGTRWAIEEAFQAAKNECGLGQYEVRRYPGWYRHITPAMLAHAILAALAAQATEKGIAETTPPAPSPSPW